ncbi:hypothetical protein [Solicola gregarius]|nr:hypothetical protein [Solicola gregarius]
MSIEPQGRAGRRRADTPDEMSGIVMMLGLMAILCILAVLFV